MFYEIAPMILLHFSSFITFYDSFVYYIFQVIQFKKFAPVMPAYLLSHNGTWWRQMAADDRIEGSANGLAVAGKPYRNARG